MIPHAPPRRDAFELLSRVLTLTTAALAVIAAFGAPVLALSWSQQAFLGFLVDPPLVVSGTGGSGWTGALAGVKYPQRVLRVGGAPVATSDEFNARLAALEPGQFVSLFTASPDGASRLFPAILTTRFPQDDLLRLFWVPYLVGLVYLAIGIWIFRLQGQTRPGRAFAFFCFCAAIVCILLFDLSSTHDGAELWTLAMALMGGALISLAMRFPQEWAIVKQRPWLLGAPYALSLVFGVWGVLALNSVWPWAYIAAWGASYRYTGLGVIVFLCLIAYRTVAPGPQVVQQQARVMLLGSALAFLPITIWFLAPLFGRNVAFDTVLFLPALLIFPLGVLTAILRYRLLEVDQFANRALLYGAVTAVLAGVFTVTTALLQKLFVRLTGGESNTALLIATLVIVAAFEPVKRRLQGFVERRLKTPIGSASPVSDFSAQVRSYIQMSDPYELTLRLLEEASRGLGAQSGAVSLAEGESFRTRHTVGRWRGDGVICLPLDYGGQRYGLLWLGPRADPRPYTRQDCEALQETVTQVARAVHLATQGRGV
jgi:hypothetical protein